MKKNLFNLLFVLCSLTGYGQWEQIGNTIPGESDLFAKVSLSDNGKVVAVGAVRNAANGILSGRVSIYEYNGYWIQKGQSLYGEVTNEVFGQAVSLNEDGTILAVGAPGTISSVNYAGRLRIYQYNGTEWIQLGGDINGENTGDRFGSSVSISDDGYTVAVSAGNAEGVKIYHYTDGNWEQAGTDLAITATSVSLSADGSIIAARSDEQVRVYQYTNDDWVQLGGDLESYISYDSNQTISLNSDGVTLAIGFPHDNDDGRGVKIFRYINNTWSQIGQSIEGDVTNGRLGYSVSLNSIGNVFAAGALYNSDYASNAGKVIIMKYNESDNVWEQSGQTIYGSEPGDAFGFSVGLSADGTVSTIGAYDSNYIPRPPFYIWGGFVQLYQNCDILSLTVDQGNSLEICAESPVSLTASSEGEIINWYDSSDGEEPVFTGTEFTVSGLSITTSYWVEAVTESGAGCTTERQQVTITVNPVPELVVEETEIALCSGESITLSATSEGNTVNWYDSEDAEEPVFSGPEYYIPELNETTSYWLQAVNESGCASERTQITVTVSPTPVLTVAQTSLEACEFTFITLYASTDTGEVKWYDSEDATEEIFTGNEYTISELTETVSYWVQAGTEAGCNSERVEIVVTVLPAPVLNIETTEWAVCSGSEAELFATSAGNVIFWYANEDDDEYLYHGNLFITEVLTETTTFWVEAYNIITGCSSEKTEVNVTVNPVPDAPIAVSYQTVEEGTTLADLDVEANGTLTWYADQALTVVLPGTTLAEENTIYYVTQTIAGCESEAAEVSVGFLGLTDINGNSFAVYPNPTSGIVKIQSKVAVSNIEVFNINGQAVTLAKATNEVNLSGYPSGTYIVRVTLENGEILTRKVIKK